MSNNKQDKFSVENFNTHDIQAILKGGPHISKRDNNRKSKNFRTQKEHKRIVSQIKMLRLLKLLPNDHKSIVNKV